jgi:hypothetical protein
MPTKEEIMRRREFLTATLVGLAVPGEVLNQAARLEPVSAVGSLASQVDGLERTVYIHAMEFPTTPTVEQLPRLLRDYAGFLRLSDETRHRFRIEHGLTQLCAFIGANLATWHDYGAAHAWYAAGLWHAERGQAREAAAWIAARSTLIAAHQGDDTQLLQDASFAVMLSAPGQLGATLGNALAATSLAKIGHRAAAYQALDDARRAVDRQTDQETFTAYSMPWYRLGRFASEVHTHLGEFKRAQAYQKESLPAYPPGATTDTTFLRLDAAEAVTRQGHPEEGAEQTASALLVLAPRQAAPILADRAERVSQVIGWSGYDTGQLRHVIGNVRRGSGARG